MGAFQNLSNFEILLITCFILIVHQIANLKINVFFQKNGKPNLTFFFQKFKIHLGSKYETNLKELQYLCRLQCFVFLYAVYFRSQIDLNIIKLVEFFLFSIFNYFRTEISWTNPHCMKVILLDHQIL